MSTALYVINGPSGAGKSHLLRHVEDRFDRARAIPKLTTRPRHPGETDEVWSDLIHVSDEEFADLNPEFSYRWNSCRYGIARADLLRYLDGARMGLVVVRDVRTIRQLATELRGVEVIPVYVSAGASARRERLVSAGLEDEEISRRLQRESDPARHLESCADLYRSCLENDSSVESFHEKIATLVAPHLGGRIG